MMLEKLKKFRQEAYHLLGPAKDATFELMDAVLLSRSVYSFAELSLSPVFRRRWPSLYESLEDSRPSRHKLMKLYIKHVRSEERVILAGDHTPWTRREAVTLKDRTYEHGANVISGKPVTLGHGYSTIAWIPEKKGSWALPLRHERITSFENAISKGAEQLRQVCLQLGGRPISLWDSEYGCASFVNQTADIEADKLMRLRPNRCLWGPPPPYSGKGRPKKHGAKFKLSDRATWGIPLESIEMDDPTWGKVEIQRWSQLHFLQAADHPMEVILVQRKGKKLSSKAAKPMWLAWVGEQIPSVEQVWHQYLRRFAVDHWNRLAKQRLHWTLPKLGTPEQGQRWSDLMPLMTWQLWLAREIVTDKPLPWQKSQEAASLTPGRVAQAFGGVLAAIGTPACAPKPRGKSPGWQKGKKRTKRTRYPVVKKGFSRGKKGKQKST